MNKRSKRLMKTLANQKGHEGNYFSVSEICDLTGQSRDDVIAICDYLVSQDCMKREYLTGPGRTSGYDGPNLAGYTLLEKAISHKEFSRMEFLCYLKDNWIAILALIVAIIALFT